MSERVLIHKHPNLFVITHFSFNKCVFLFMFFQFARQIGGKKCVDKIISFATSPRYKCLTGLHAATASLEYRLTY